jgi:lipoprotein-releasing system permease protein
VTDDWTQLNQSLYSALWLEKMAISIALALIMLVAALHIVASLVMLVMEKSRDIAILKTMGAGVRSMRHIFMLQGVIIGVVGTTVGAGAGYLIATVMDHYRVIRMPPDAYQIPYVPFVVDPIDFLVVVVSALLVCLLATIYPSRHAGRVDPAEALRFQ